LRTFRVIHVASFVAYLTSVAHGLFSGTDTSLAMTQLMYAGTFLVVVFLTIYWLIVARSQKAALAPVPPANPPAQPARAIPQGQYIQAGRMGQPIQPGQLLRPPANPAPPRASTTRPPR